MAHLNQELIEFIIARARITVDPRFIILFGSRGRGDARETSDYDIAFDFAAELNHDDWARFCIELQEDAPTLLHMDLVNMNEIDARFRAKILSEGKVVYKGE